MISIRLRECPNHIQVGKRSYKARLKRFGLARLQQIARENGKKGGKPKGS